MLPAVTRGTKQRKSFLHSIVLILFIFWTTFLFAQDNASNDWTKAVSDMPPAPSTRQEWLLRHARNSRFDDSTKIKKRLDLPQDGTHGTGMSVYYVRIPPLPSSQSDAVLMGTVTTSRAYFSNDRTAIYTELLINVEKVYKDRLRCVRNEIATLDLGGAIRLPNGRIAKQFTIPMQNRLYFGKRYVLFLDFFAPTQTFNVAKAWELRAGIAMPLSETDIKDAMSGKSNYAGLAEAAFLDAVQASVSPASQ